MRQLYIKPQIHKFDNFAGFSKEFGIGRGDLVFTHEFIYEPFMKSLNLEADYMFQERYGAGEPSNTMIDSIISDIGDKEYKRIIAVGGGTVIDIAKLFALQGPYKTLDMFERKVPLVQKTILINF